MKKNISAVTFKKSSKQRLACFIIVNKYKALKEIDAGQNCLTTAKKYVVAKNTVLHWVKKKAEIFEAVEGNNAFKKRKELDSAVLNG